MKINPNLDQLAADMIRNQGDWVALDTDGYPVTLRDRARRWSKKPPKPFRGHTFRFQVARDITSQRPLWVLMGICDGPRRNE